MKTVGSSKPVTIPLKPSKMSPSTRDLLPLKLESRQSIKLLPVTPVNAKAQMIRKMSKSHLELPSTDTSRVTKQPGTPRQPPTLSNSTLTDDKRSSIGQPLVSERGKTGQSRPLPPAKLPPPKTPTKSEPTAALEVNRRGSNSNLAIPTLSPEMDMFVTEVFEDRPTPSLASADTTFDRFNFRKDALQATASTCAVGRTTGHLKCDSVNLDSSKPNSITPFVTRSFLELTHKTDKDRRTPLTDTISLLEERMKYPLITAELLGTYSRMSSAVKGSVDKRRRAARESRKVALVELREKMELLEDKCISRGLTDLRRSVNHLQRLRKRQAFRAMMAVSRS